MSWTDPGFLVGAVGGAAGVFAAIYAYLPYRSGRRTDSRHKFVDERKFLAEHRVELTQLAFDAERASNPATSLAGMLSRDRWVPPSLVQLSEVAINLDLSTPAVQFDSRVLKLAGQTLPWTEGATRFRSYSSAMGELARPRLFQDLPCYRLFSADLSGPFPQITVGTTSFFAGINESEALAHEFARSHLGENRRIRKTGKSSLPLRSALSQTPYQHRNAIFSVSALTFRVEGRNATFFLHARDPAAVAIAGSVLHLAPSGVFQPTAEDEEILLRDCSPWLTLCREYAEEFLGVEEAQGEAGVALSYTEDEPYASINRAYHEAHARVYVCGLGIDPLTFCPEIVTVACFDHVQYDALFAQMVARNQEGFLRGRALRGGRVIGYDFTQATVASLLNSGKLSPAATAAISRAWDEREVLGIG